MLDSAVIAGRAVGPLRDQKAVEESITLQIPSMLHSVFDKPVGGMVDRPQSRDPMPAGT
jgi:hypothetical protein